MNILEKEKEKTPEGRLNFENEILNKRKKNKTNSIGLNTRFIILYRKMNSVLKPENVFDLDKNNYYWLKVYNLGIRSLLAYFIPFKTLHFVKTIALRVLPEDTCPSFKLLLTAKRFGRCHLF